MAVAGILLRAGAAKVDITPPLGTPMSGSFQERRAAAVDDPLHARAFVLERGDLRLALVACDIICLPADDVARTRALIADWSGIPAGHVQLAATHTHTAGSPTGLLGTPRADAYMAALPTELPADVQTLRAGDLAIVGLPGETGFDQGGYETWAARSAAVERGSGERLVATATALLAKAFAAKRTAYAFDGPVQSSVEARIAIDRVDLADPVSSSARPLATGGRGLPGRRCSPVVAPSTPTIGASASGPPG